MQRALKTTGLVPMPHGVCSNHVKAWSLGGEIIEENLQTLCEACNQGKSNVL